MCGKTVAKILALNTFVESFNLCEMIEKNGNVAASQSQMYFAWIYLNQYINIDKEFVSRWMTSTTSSIK